MYRQLRDNNSIRSIAMEEFNTCPTRPYDKQMRFLSELQTEWRSDTEIDQTLRDRCSIKQIIHRVHSVEKWNISRHFKPDIALSIQLQTHLS